MLDTNAHKIRMYITRKIIELIVFIINATVLSIFVSISNVLSYSVLVILKTLIFIMFGGVQIGKWLRNARHKTADDKFGAQEKHPIFTSAFHHKDSDGQMYLVFCNFVRVNGCAFNPGEITSFGNSIGSITTIDGKAMDIQVDLHGIEAEDLAPGEYQPECLVPKCLPVHWDRRSRSTSSTSSSDSGTMEIEMTHSKDVLTACSIPDLGASPSPGSYSPPITRLQKRMRSISNVSL